MGYCKFDFLAVLLMFGAVVDAASSVSFDDTYEVLWGSRHVNFLNERRGVQLSMDRASGAGFVSKQSYGSGFFEMKIKLPGKDTAGVVTSFYLTSNSSKHDELDFEFLGNREGKPITLQTNVFVDGIGNREQRMLLWFDPSADFHSYKILWNLYHIVFYVDNIPIRVFRNQNSIKVKYPKQPMRVDVSIWNGEDWATDGGKTKINWSHAPFIAQFQDFDIKSGCAINQATKTCFDPKYWWNNWKYSKLSGKEMRQLQHVREKYMNYNYCDDVNRHPHPPPECILINN